MRLSVYAGDGGSMRSATKFTFATDEGVKVTVAGGNQVLDVDEVGQAPVQLTDVVEAAHVVAGLLYRYQDHCLVVHPSGYSSRGNEGTTADVYPQAGQPRINVEG